MEPPARSRAIPRQQLADARAWGLPQALRSVKVLLTQRERMGLALIVGLAPVAALSELGGVAGMLPFLAAISDPAAAASSSLGALLPRVLGHALPSEQVIVASGILACAILVVTNAIIVANSWLMLRFSWGLHHRLSTTLLGRYLNRPYESFLSENTSQLASNLMVQVRLSTEGVLVPMVTAFGRVVATLALLLLLGLMEPRLALAALLLVTSVYYFFYSGIARKKLSELGKRRVPTEHALGRIVSEAFGGIKEMKLRHSEQACVDAYSPLARALAHDNAITMLIAIAPRYIVETIAFGAVVIVTLVVSWADHASGRLLPLLGMFGFAGYRLMPSMQQIFSCLVTIRANLPALERIADDLVEHDAPLAEVVRPEAGDPIVPQRAVELRDVTFRYPGREAPALDGFSLVLKANSTTGIVGRSGAGKTTALDVLLGLLRPASGELLIDDRPIDPTQLERWQRVIGYVPQHIYLSDASIAQNVAFGVPLEQIDRARVEEACRSAQLHDFVAELPEGYDTQVGERGVCISGGERQRVGIARALYRRPEVLVLDEATSALDGATEESVMQAIQQLAGEKTILIIAHRETTLRVCDVIYRIARGRAERVGSYADLLEEPVRRSAGAVRRRPA